MVPSVSKQHCPAVARCLFAVPPGRYISWQAPITFVPGDY